MKQEEKRRECDVYHTCVNDGGTFFWRNWTPQNRDEVDVKEEDMNKTEMRLHSDRRCHNYDRLALLGNLSP